MKKSFKDSLLSLNVMLFFILTAIFLTVLFSPLIHQSDVSKYRLDVYSGLSREEIKRNFASLSGYLWLFRQAPLQLESFPMSTAGAIHFAEVKRLVDGLQVLWIISGFIVVFGACRYLKRKDIAFMAQAAKLMIIVPTTIGLLAATNFDRAFVTFHHLFFNNNYWIFDERYDPVIKILPEEFFMHCFIAIIIFVLLFALGLYGSYRYQIKRILKQLD